MKYIIIEDEPLAIEKVRIYAGKVPGLEFAAEFEQAIPALEYLKTHRVDLIFLDINIGGISGIQLLEIAHPDCAVIILTAHAEYAIKGFEMNVTDYLLKPFSFERFWQAVTRARELHGRNDKEKTYLFVKTRYRLEKILLNELLYIEGAGDYRKIYTTNGELMTLETFGQFEKHLSPGRFIRVHKSYLISLERITCFEQDFVRIENQLIPVSETYKKGLLAKLKK